MHPNKTKAEKRVKPPYEVRESDIRLIKEGAEKDGISKGEWLRQAIREKHGRDMEV